MAAHDTEKRAKLIERIKAMRAMTPEKGASEAEADNAARIAAELMARYQIDESLIADSEFSRYLLPIRGVRLSYNQTHPFVAVVGGVSHITGTKSFLSERGLWVVGDEVGRELASYLYELTHDALNRAWKAERLARIERGNKLWRDSVAKHDDPVLRERLGDTLPASAWDDEESAQVLRDAGCAVDHKARRSFMAGMAFRMGKRMEAMAPARRVPEETVKRLMSDLNDTTGKERPPSGDFDVSAMRSGFKTGESVPINMGIGQARSDALKISDDGSAS